MKRGRSHHSANHELVLAALRRAQRPLTAYQLLDRLRARGLCAAPTIYRALDRLIRTGQAHRLESLNAFVACTRPEHAELAAFAICTACGSAVEIADHRLSTCIADTADRAGFGLQRAALEMHGQCKSCDELAGTGPAPTQQKRRPKPESAGGRVD